jgi:hypothetical protein
MKSKGNNIKEAVEIKTKKEPINKTKQIEFLEPVKNQKGELIWLCREANGKRKSFSIVARDYPPYKKNSKLLLCNQLEAFFMGPPLLVLDEGLWKYPIAKSMKNLDIVEIYNQIINLARKVIVFSEEVEYKILTLWVLSTWKLGCWRSVGFPIFVGLPESGKSTCMSFLNQLSFRGVKMSGSTDLVISRLSDCWNVTMLFDEAHDDLKKGMRYKFIKDSYKKDGRYIKCDNKNDTGIISLNNFGFKAFAGETLVNFDEAIQSRGIIFQMIKSKPEYYIEEVMDEFISLRTKLLNYRYTYQNPSILPKNHVFGGRLDEIFSSILRTAFQIHVPVTDILRFARGNIITRKEWLKNTPEYEVLTMLLYRQKITKTDTIFNCPSVDLRTLLYDLNWLKIKQDVDNSSFWHKLMVDKSRYLGKILSRLGIKTYRTCSVRYVVFDHRNLSILKRLWEKYSVTISENRLLGLNAWENL